MHFLRCSKAVEDRRLGQPLVAHGTIRPGCRDLERPRRGMLRKVRADERTACGGDLRELRLVDRHVGRGIVTPWDAPSARIRSAAVWALVSMAACTRSAAMPMSAVRAARQSTQPT